MHGTLLKRGENIITSHLESLPNWRTISHEEASKIFNAYYVVLNVHQILWHLLQCLILRLSQKEKAQASVLIKEGSILIEKPLEMLSILDGQSFSDKSNTYFKHVFGLYHSNTRNTRKKQVINYMGKNMQRKNLTRTDFSRSLLIATNLVQASLYGASFFGADMRDTNICDTDVSNCLFLTQFQINSAKGNCNTILPPYLLKPKIWDCDERETLLLLK